jgi:hypothetical protein
MSWKKEDYIDEKWVMDKLVNGSCIYCADPFDLYNTDQFSVDRVDNSLPHVKTNCQVCCVWCNGCKK